MSASIGHLRETDDDDIESSLANRADFASLYPASPLRDLMHRMVLQTARTGALLLSGLVLLGEMLFKLFKLLELIEHLEPR